MTPRDETDTPGGDLAGLLGRVGEWSGLDPLEVGVVPASVVRDAVVGLAEVLGRLEAEAGRWLGAFESRGLAVADGARSAKGWLTARTELAPEHAGGLVARARDLRSTPAVAAAYAGGEVGTAKVRALLAARKAHPDLFGEHEAGLVAKVTPLTVEHARIAAARWAQLAQATKEWEDAEAAQDRARDARPDSDDPDGSGNGDPPIAPAPDPAAGNTLWLGHGLGGRWNGHFDLDALTGAELDAAINAEIDTRFQDGTYHPSDAIAASRRRADCLAALVARARRPDTTCHGEPRPSISIHIDPNTLAGHPAHTLNDGLNRDCGLDDGTPLDPRSIERLLCTSRIKALWIRLQTEGPVEVLGITDLLRDATRKQRRALRRRDGRCTFPGCNAPADRCEVHHITPHEDLGPTLTHNLVLLCPHHHHLVHEGNWRLWRAPQDNQLHLVDPTGQPHHLRPHGQQIPLQPPPHPPPIPPPLRPPRFAHPRTEPPGA